jgi:hypothetical protein
VFWSKNSRNYYVGSFFGKLFSRAAKRPYECGLHSSLKDSGFWVAQRFTAAMSPLF